MYIESTSGQLRSMTSGSSSEGFQFVSACMWYIRHTEFIVRIRLYGLLVREPDLRSTGRGFESRSPCCRVQFWASCLHTRTSVDKQYNLVPTNGRRCSAAGKVTAGLAEGNGSIRPFYGFGNLLADCWGSGSAPEPYARFEYGATF